MLVKRVFCVGIEFSWDRKSTHLLLENYRRLKSQFRDPKTKKKSLWTRIKEVFAKHNYKVTEDTLDRKWRNMKKTYTVIKDNTKRTGRGRVSWEHYDDFEDIYAEDRTVNIPKIISSTVKQLPSTAEAIPSTSTAPEPVSVPPLTPSSSVPPRTPCSAKRNQAIKMSGTYRQRKQQIDLEEKRLEEIKLLRLAIEESNNIQRERNNILKELVKK